MSILEELGVRRVINCCGPLSILGGSVLSREVIQAMNEVAKVFVDMDELQDRASDIIAEVTGAEAGLVTSGCAAALVLGTAACMTGLDINKMRRLPDTTGLKNEVIIQKNDRNVYDYMFRIAGAKLVEVGTDQGTSPAEIEAAINEKTVALAYVPTSWLEVKPRLAVEEIINIAKKYKIYTIIDAASLLYKKDDLKKFVEAGADLVAFSGGKVLQGPNDTGILCGKKELIRAARILSNLDATKGMFIGRPCKVSKEQIVGLLVALKQYLVKDFEAEIRSWEKKLEYISKSLETIPHMKIEIFKSQQDNIVPYLKISLDEKRLGISEREFVNKLKEGNPSIRIYGGDYPRPNTPLLIFPNTLLEGDEEIIVRKIKEILNY